MGEASVCIFCKRSLAEIQPSDEHPFAESIGGSFTIDQVCVECNSNLGRLIDPALTADWLVGSRRRHYRIEGKKAKKGRKGKGGARWNLPNLLRNATIIDSPVSDLEVRFSVDAETNAVVSQLTPMGPTKEDASRPYVAATIEQLREMINKRRARDGEHQLTLEETERIAQHGRIVNPDVHIKEQFDLRKRDQAILKIAYEMAWYWLGDEYLEDQTGEIIRQCVLGEAMTLGDAHGWLTHGGYCSPQDTHPIIRSRAAPLVSLARQDRATTTRT